MTGRNPRKCQNCGYSTRYSRQQPGELPAYCVNHQAWLCAGCRELRECNEVGHRIEQAPARTDVQNSIPPNDGIYANIDDDVYHSDLDSLSSSGARALLSGTPEEFDYNRREPRDPKPAYDFGHAAHKMVLGIGSRLKMLDPKVDGLKADGTVAHSPASTAKWKAADAKARAEGKLPIARANMEKAQTMAGQVFAHRVAAKLLSASDGVAEHSIYWHDDQTGVRRRIRPDYLSVNGFARPMCLDYKTARSADPKHFQRAVLDWGYHCQQAYYEDGLAELGIENCGFLFIVQAKDAPHSVSVCSIEPEIVELGRRQNRQALELFAKCTADDNWPGYDGIHTVGMASWAVKQIEESLESTI